MPEGRGCCIRMPNRSPFLKYLVAVFFVALIFLVKLLLTFVLGIRGPFRLFLIATVASTWYGGLGPGLLATAIATLTADYFFLSPLYSLFALQPAQRVLMGLFLLEGTVVAGITAAFRSSHQRAEQSIREKHLEIEERKRAEQALSESEERFRLMADSTPVMIWMSGINRQCDWFNRPWLEFTGRTLEHQLDGGWTEGIHPDDLQRCLHIYQSSFDVRKDFSMEYRLRRADGEYRWVLDMGTPRFKGDGSFAGYIGSCIDVQDSKAAQEVREQFLASEQAARAKAEWATQMKDEFLATLSHELRTPLNAILGWARMLETGTLDKSTTEQALATVARNAQAQARLIDDLLDGSRIVSGQLRLTIGTVDPAALIQKVVDSMHFSLSSKGIRLDATLDPEVGQISGDSERLQQVIWNLLSNAIKFTPKGGSVSIQLSKIRSQVELTVADTGKGIALEFLPNIFDRFSHPDSSTTRPYGGLGLGLAIVRHLVERHGGTIQAYSSGEGKGATFTVTLPIAPISGNLTAPQNQLPLEDSYRPAPPDSTSLDGLEILAVDDEPDALTLLVAALKGRGAAVRPAASVAEALKLLAVSRSSIIVADIGMPKEDGYALIRQVRALTPAQGGDTPALALSAHARPEDRQRALTAGYDMHIGKPVELAELVDGIARLARRSHQTHSPSLPPF